MWKVSVLKLFSLNQSLLRVYGNSNEGTLSLNDETMQSGEFVSAVDHLGRGRQPVADSRPRPDAVFTEQEVSELVTGVQVEHLSHSSFPSNS